MEKNITKSLTLGERLATSYRTSWLELELDGSVDYTNTKNNLQSMSNLRTWQFAYGGTLSLNLPWNMSISTDLHQNSRRGYSDASLNTNELLWNAQISQSMLKGNALTFSLQFYDILRQQSNLSRVINSMSRTDTEYNSINSYIMLRATYRLNLFGGKNAMPKPRMAQTSTAMVLVWVHVQMVVLLATVAVVLLWAVDSVDSNSSPPIPLRTSGH